MKQILIGAVLLLASSPVLADEVQVRTDREGVQTFTNVPASQRSSKLPAKDRNGVQVFRNVPTSSVGEAKPAHQPRPDIPAKAGLPEAPLQEPPQYAAQVEPGPPAAPQSAANGQWVYTDQDGWLWMPYGNQYVSEGSTGDADPYAYVYEPGAGWTWLPAPWVWGWGAYPYFGALGPGRFGWYTGLVHAGYGWGGYRGGPRAGLARNLAARERRGGAGFRGSRGPGDGRGAGFRLGAGPRAASASPHRGYSSGGGFSGGGGGHAIGNGGGRHGGGGRR